MTNTTSGNGAAGNMPHDPVASVLNRPHPGQVALACAALGWRVLPLNRETKRPVLRAWPERATSDTDEIIDWWSNQYAGHATGVATGRGSGIWVLDVDNHGRGGPNGFETLAELERNYEPLPETFTVRTPSGGEHRYLEYPADVDVITKPNTLGPGLDTRGFGGQVVAPGTWTVAGEYRVVRDGAIAVAPEWLVRLVTRRDSSVGWSDEELYDWDGNVRTGGVTQSIEQWLAEAETLGDGDQEWFLFRFVSSLRARAVPPDEMRRLGWEAAQRFQVFNEQEPWIERDVAEKVTSVCRYPPGSSGATRVVDTIEREETSVSEPVDAGGEGGAVGGSQDVTVAEGAVALRTVQVEDVGELPVIGGAPDNPWRATDRANGIEVARFLDGKAFWSPEQGWYVWDGRRWAPDTELVRLLLAGEYIDELRRRATSGAAGRDEAEMLMQRATRIESKGGLDNAMAWAQAYVAVSVTRLDADPWLLNCPNGTLDLRTSELCQHDPRDLITRITPTPYVAAAEDDVWDRVRREALEADEHRLRLLARFAGYTLTGRTTEKRMLVVSGPTNTAKSTVTEPLYRALGAVHDGGYATTWDADVVQLDSRVNRSEKLNKARGARMVLVGELEKGSRMADSFVKQFTGGDTMDARGLYKDSYSYRPTAKLWMATNYVPQSPDKALQERLLLLPFHREPVVKDPRVKAHLEDSADAQQAILAWAARGCAWWQRERTLGSTPWLDAAKRRYALESDPILQFIEERLDKVPGYTESSHVDEVWLAYQTWGVENQNRPLKRRKLEQALEEHGLSRGKGPKSKGPTRWVGRRVMTTES